MTERRRGSAVVLSVAGDVDMTTAAEFDGAIDHALSAGPRHLVLDLEDVEFFASAGVAALVAAHQAARRCRFVVVAGAAAGRSLRLSGVDLDLALYDSVEEAVANG